MEYPLLLATPAVTILADAPSKVPLPPRHAPRLRAQAKVLRFSVGKLSARIL